MSVPPPGGKASALARIDQALGKIGGEIGQHIEQHDDEDAALDDRIIARADGVIDQ